MDDPLLVPDDAAELLGVCRARVTQLRKQGRLGFETISTVSPTSKYTLYRYRLSTLLECMASRSATDTALASAKLHAMTRHRLKLARLADRARVVAVYHGRIAHNARVEAAEAGHKPSIARLLDQEF